MSSVSETSSSDKESLSGVEGPNDRTELENNGEQRDGENEDQDGAAESESGAESSDDETEPLPTADEIKQKLVEITGKLQNGELNKEHRAEFWTENAKYLIAHESQTWRNPGATDIKKYDRPVNLLHILADRGKMAFAAATHQWLLDDLLDRCPSLMAEIDRHDKRPLDEAIESSNINFINGVLASKYAETEDFKSVLESPKHQTLGETCIHSAILQELESSVTIKLIQKASPNAFIAKQGERGLTPLHLAVEYSRCKDSRIPVVKALIKYGDGAFDEESAGLSVYRHHLQSIVVEKTAVAKQRNDIPTKKRPKSKSKVSKTSYEQSGPNEEEKGSGKRSRRTEDLPGSIVEEGEKFKETALKMKEGLSMPPPVLPVLPREMRVRGPTDTVVEPSLPAPIIIPPPSIRRRSTAKSGTPVASTNQIPPQYGPNEKRQMHSEDSGLRTEKAAKNSKSGSGRESSKKNRPKPSQQSSSQIIPQEHPTDVAAKTVAKLLKLHYLQTIFTPITSYDNQNVMESYRQPKDAKTRNHDSAVKFLYGDNKDYVQISLDFLEEGRDSSGTIQTDDFRQAYGKFKYDEVLHYVAFRKVDLEGCDLSEPLWKVSHLQLPVDSAPFGRVEMVFFFRWLFHEKKVRNIIKAIVEDDHVDRPHSDEAIEAALAGIDVEILDWRKLDMCPMSIRRACKDSNLREIHLQWSGNNAILRAWSDPEGLAKIETLKFIYLHPKKGLDSKVRVEANITEFHERINKVREQLNYEHITIPDALAEKSGSRRVGGKLAVAAESKLQVDTYEWLEVMDAFSNGLINFDEPLLKTEGLPKALSEDVIVALIDDGVDILHPTIINNIEGGQSFDRGYDDPNLEGGKSPFQRSATGHGTLMAYMISRICPRVKILVCKLDVYQKSSPKGITASFTPGSAADAVNVAVDRGVDIISISWTIKLGEYNATDMGRLKTAIQRACNRGILVFCAAPDIGILGDEEFQKYYPIGCESGERMFRIGAATADGRTYRWTPEAGKGQNIDFTLPGHNVTPKPGDIVTQDDMSPKTGSSIATALAAGLAALVIHCVRLGAIYSFIEERKKSLPPSDRPMGENGSRSGGVSANEDLGGGGSVGKKSPGWLTSDSLASIKQFKKMKATFSRSLKNENVFDKPGKIISVDNKKKPSDDDKMTEVFDLAMSFVSAS